MDFESLYDFYKNDFAKENMEYPPRKVYKTLLKDVKYLIIASRDAETEATAKVFDLEQDLFWKTTDLEPNEHPHYILLSTGSRKPYGYGRLIEASQRKETDMIRFMNIFLMLKEMIISFNKEYKLKIENIISLQALLEVASDSFLEYIDHYDKLIQEIKEKLQNNEIPTLKNISGCAELQIFIQDTFVNDFCAEGLSRKKTIKHFLHSKFMDNDENE